MPTNAGWKPRRRVLPPLCSTRYPICPSLQLDLDGCPTSMSRTFPTGSPSDLAFPTLLEPYCLPDDPATLIETCSNDILARPFRHHDGNTLRVPICVLESGGGERIWPDSLPPVATDEPARQRPAHGYQLLRTHNRCGTRSYHTSDSTSRILAARKTTTTSAATTKRRARATTNLPTTPAAPENQCDTAACYPGVDWTSAAHHPIDSPTAPPTRKTKDERQ